MFSACYEQLKEVLFATLEMYAFSTLLHAKTLKEAGEIVSLICHISHSPVETDLLMNNFRNLLNLMGCLPDGNVQQFQKVEEDSYTTDVLDNDDDTGEKDYFIKEEGHNSMCGQVLL